MPSNLPYHVHTNEIGHGFLNGVSRHTEILSHGSLTGKTGLKSKNVHDNEPFIWSEPRSTRKKEVGYFREVFLGIYFCGNIAHDFLLDGFFQPNNFRAS